MSYLQLMQNRYTTKKYDSTYSIEPSKIDELKRILTLTPSSINSQPWHFSLVSNPDIKKELSLFSFFNSEKVVECSHLLVFHVLDNLEIFEQQLSQSGESYLLYFQNMRNNLGDERAKVWLSKQLYIALGIALSACADLNIDATPMEGIQNEEYDRILGIKNYKVVLAVAMGRHHTDDYNHISKVAKKRFETKQIFTDFA